MPSSNSIWLFAEHIQGRLSDGYRELLAMAQELSAGRLDSITTILLGWQIQEVSIRIDELAASNLVVVNHPMLDEYHSELYLQAIHTLISRHHPDLVLFESGPIGDDLAARLAARLNIGLVTGCNHLEFDAYSNLLLFKSLREGDVQAICTNPNSQPQLATVRVGGNRLAALQRITAPQHTQERVEFAPASARTEPKGLLILDPDNLDLEQADVVVDGGQGMGSAEGFELLDDLARTLGGKVGCSRTVVDLGWQPREHQIGQTGKKVRPSLLIACGISGSMYHTAGIRNAGSIVAINKDPQAPIFELADLGVIGDVQQVIPALIKVLSERAEIQ